MFLPLFSIYHFLSASQEDKTRKITRGQTFNWYIPYLSNNEQPKTCWFSKNKMKTQLSFNYFQKNIKLRKEKGTQNKTESTNNQFLL